MHDGGICGVRKAIKVLRGEESFIDLRVERGQKAILRRIEHKLVEA